MTGLVLLSAAGTGIGLWLIVIGLWPRPLRLDKALAALDPAPEPVAAVPDELAGWDARLGRPAVRYLLRLGLPTERTRRELAAIGKPVGVHLAEQATAAVTGLLVPPLLATLLAAAGVHLGVTMPGVASLVLTAPPVGRTRIDDVSLSHSATASSSLKLGGVAAVLLSCTPVFS